MEEKNLTQITFGSFLKINMHMFFALGFGLGVILLIMSIFGGDVYANIGSIHLTGVQAGIASLFLAPPIMSIISILIALLGYLPFKIYLKLIKGIKINGLWN